MFAGSLVDMGDMLIWRKFLAERNMSFGSAGSGFESLALLFLGEKSLKALASHIGIMTANKMAFVQYPVQCHTGVVITL